MDSLVYSLLSLFFSGEKKRRFQYIVRLNDQLNMSGPTPIRWKFLIMPHELENKISSFKSKPNPFILRSHKFLLRALKERRPTYAVFGADKMMIIDEQIKCQKDFIKQAKLITKQTEPKTKLAFKEKKRSNNELIYFDLSDNRVLRVLNKFSEVVDGNEPFIEKGKDGFVYSTGKGRKQYFSPFIFTLCQPELLDYPVAHVREIIEEAIDVFDFTGEYLENYLPPKAYKGEILLEFLEKIKPWINEDDFEKIKNRLKSRGVTKDI